MTRGPLPAAPVRPRARSGRRAGTASATGNYMQRFLNEQGFIAVATDWTGPPPPTTPPRALPSRTSTTSHHHRPAPAVARQRDGASARRGRSSARTRPSPSAAARRSTRRARLLLRHLARGIMGTSFLGYSPDCDRGVVNVAGGNWGSLLQRSSNFRGFEFAFRDYLDRVDRRCSSLAQSLFDPSGPDQRRAPPPARPPARHAREARALPVRRRRRAGEQLPRLRHRRPLDADPADVPVAADALRPPTTMGPADLPHHLGRAPHPAPPGTNKPPRPTTAPTAASATSPPSRPRSPASSSPPGASSTPATGPCDPQ